MLRALVAALLLANIVFYVWTQGWLDDYVPVRSIGDREPERMARQVHPELVRILPDEPAASASSPTAAALATPVELVCLEVGPFNDAELVAAKSEAKSELPGADLVDLKTDKPGDWMIYMGRFADQDALDKRIDELKRRKLPYTEVRNNGALAPGLSLGRFEDRAAAANALELLTQQGTRTARIIEIAPTTASHFLRIEKADPPLTAQAASLRIGAAARSFALCSARP